MVTDSEIRDNVTDELRWDPQLIDADAIGVGVTDGAVTLSGHASSYAQKMAVARAAERVYGVKAVANELRVELGGELRDDSDIAKAIAHVLEWNVQIPEDAVHAVVQHNWVTLDGEVDYDYQRREVERMVGQIRGVIGVTNTISIKPQATLEQVQNVIKDAFEREAQIDARNISVRVDGHIATLDGSVHSLHEATAARTAAASAPGVVTVESHLVITP